MSAPVPFHLAVPDETLADLRRRLRDTRWPEKETVDDWSQGVPLAAIRALCDYWLEGYDWRRCETRLNTWGQFKVTMDGLDIHFLHIRSPEPDAMPLLMTHGWPGSVIEFGKVVGPLTDPVAHGGQAGDAFHLILPSIPGYGFSAKPHAAGCGVERIARLWAELMRRLGYDRYVAQGGDWGAAITSAMAAQAPAGLLGIHLNCPMTFPPPEARTDMTPREAEAIRDLDAFLADEQGYALLQRTRPQTLAYGLTDSPAGQAAWIFEKFARWTDCAGDPLSILTRDEILDNIMLYWLTASAGSSARLYWESMGEGFSSPVIDMPVGCSIFPKEIFRPSRRWSEASYKNIVHWNELDRGGHFAAFEQPDLFVSELRNFLKPLR